MAQLPIQLPLPLVIVLPYMGEHTDSVVVDFDVTPVSFTCRGAPLPESANECEFGQAEYDWYLKQWGM